MSPREALEYVDGILRDQALKFPLGAAEKTLNALKSLEDAVVDHERLLLEASAKKMATPEAWAAPKNIGGKPV